MCCVEYIFLRRDFHIIVSGHVKFLFESTRILSLGWAELSLVVGFKVASFSLEALVPCTTITMLGPKVGPRP